MNHGFPFQFRQRVRRHVVDRLQRQWPGLFYCFWRTGVFRDKLPYFLMFFSIKKGVAMVVIMQQGMLKMLQNWVAGMLATSALRYFKNAATPNVFSVGTDFVEANFTGYTAQSPTNLVGYEQLTPSGWVEFPGYMFTGNSTNLVSQIVYGVYCNETGSPNKVLFAGLFANPVPMPAAPNVSFLTVLSLLLANSGS